jgi:hypothetical protein
LEDLLASREVVKKGVRATDSQTKRPSCRRRHDRPGIYIPGELGIRHEDTVAVTADGCENLCPRWSGTPEEPAVV